MSKILEKKVIDEIYSKVYADELQKAYNEVPYRTQTTDGNVLCAGSAAKIAVIVEQKDRILQDIVNHIQNLYQNNPKPKQRMQLDEADNLAHASKIVGIAPTSTLEEDIFATRSLSADMQGLIKSDSNIFEALFRCADGIDTLSFKTMA